MDTLTLDRGQLLTGEALKILGESSLRNPRVGLMCCIGMYAAERGVDLEQLDNKPMPGEVLEMRLDGQFGWLRHQLTVQDHKTFNGRYVETAIAAINDEVLDNNKPLPVEEREATLIRLFKQYGNIELTFTGDYAEGVARVRAAQ